MKRYKVMKWEFGLAPLESYLNQLTGEGKKVEEVSYIGDGNYIVIFSQEDGE